jgi:hypothetical protein
MQSADALGNVIVGDEFGMFAGDEQDVAEAVGEKFPGFFKDFVDGKRDPQDGVIAREATVFAIIDTFVGEIERREETDDFSETLLGELLGAERESCEKV